MNGIDLIKNLIDNPELALNKKNVRHKRKTLGLAPLPKKYKGQYGLRKGSIVLSNGWFLNYPRLGKIIEITKTRNECFPSILVKPLTSEDLPKKYRKILSNRQNKYIDKTTTYQLSSYYFNIKDLEKNYPYLIDYFFERTSCEDRYEIIEHIRETYRKGRKQNTPYL